MADEKIIWQGTSSHVRNLHIYVLCAFGCLVSTALAGGFWLFLGPPANHLVGPFMLVLALLAALYALWKFLRLRSCQYEVTTERIRVRRGLFSKRTDELELYRVKDHTLLEPFWLRLFGARNIRITSHDESSPLLVIEAVRNAKSLSEEIRKNVELCRERKKVRLAELE